MKTVEVWLYETSEPLVYNAETTYTKGPLYCVCLETETVVIKFPLMHIFRIIEAYGTHGGEKINEKK